MKARGETLQAASDRMEGVGYTTLQQLLSGHTKNPKLETLRIVAAAYDVTVAYLIGESDSGGSPLAGAYLDRIGALVEEYRAIPPGAGEDVTPELRAVQETDVAPPPPPEEESESDEEPGDDHLQTG